MVKAMRPNIVRESSCDGKIRFTSFTRAQKVAHRQAKRRHAKFQPYACGFCGGFHVGSGIGGVDNMKTRIAPLLRYAVYAVNGDGPAQLMGWSNEADGGAVSKLVAEQPGWRVTAVIERRRKAA